ncbi:MAG: carboxypeptidase-like regulatory domain-containing protein [Planctomycetota bacterium]
MNTKIILLVFAAASLALLVYLLSANHESNFSGSAEELDSNPEFDLNADVQPLNLDLQESRPRVRVDYTNTQDAVRDANCYVNGIVKTADGKPIGGAVINNIDPRRRAITTKTDAETGQFKIGPIPPGHISLKVRHPNFPPSDFFWRELKANETWNVGEIILSAGGRIAVSIINAEETQSEQESVGLIVIKMDEGNIPRTVVSHFARLREWQSDVIKTGSYILWFRGYARGSASQSIPFEISADNTTTIEVNLKDGSTHHLEIRASAKSDLKNKRYKLLVYALDSNLIEYQSIEMRTSAPVELCLMAGIYRFDVLNEENLLLLTKALDWPAKRGDGPGSSYNPIILQIE